MKSVDQDKLVQLFETNAPAMRLPLAFPELSKHRRIKEASGRKTSGVASYQRAQVMVLAFGLFAFAGAVLVLRAAVWMPGSAR